MPGGAGRQELDGAAALGREGSASAPEGSGGGRGRRALCARCPHGSPHGHPSEIYGGAGSSLRRRRECGHVRHVSRSGKAASRRNRARTGGRVMSRDIDAIDRLIADRRADGVSCARLMRDAEERAAAAAADLEAAKAARSQALSDRTSAEASYAASPGTATATALEQVDSAIRRTEILFKSAAEKMEISDRAFTCARVALEGNAAEVSSLQREREGAIVAAEYDRTAIAMMRA